MELQAQVTEIQKLYPQIYHACHVDHVKAASSEFQLSARDSAILAHLSVYELTQPAKLSKHLKVSGSTLSEAIANLESLGYVKTRKNLEDERKHNIILTEKGISAMKASSVLDSEKLLKMLSRLDVAERAEAIRGLSLLAAAALRE